MQNSTANKLIQIYLAGEDYNNIGLTEKGRLYIEFAHEKMNTKRRGYNGSKF